MNDFQYILSALPFKDPFLFVDDISSVNENGIVGNYTIKKDEYFFKGHFPENPVVPGGIISEIMVQIGLVCLTGFLYLKENKVTTELPALTSSNVEFYKAVTPGDRLTVKSKKIYFRFGKIKCEISCKLSDGTLVAKGEFSGMITRTENAEKA